MVVRTLDKAVKIASRTVPVGWMITVNICCCEDVWVELINPDEVSVEIDPLDMDIAEQVMEAINEAVRKNASDAIDMPDES